MRFVFFIFLIAICNCCVDEFIPDVSDYEDVLVIEGLITNEERPYFLRISRTRSYSEKLEKNVNNAIVLVQDKSGNIYDFQNIGSGMYKSDKNKFIAKVGKEYKLYVETEDGEVYETDYEMLKKPAQIDSVYWKYSEIGTTEKNVNKIGIQIYVNASSKDNSTQYYAYEWNDSYTFTSPYIQSFTPERCWKSDSSAAIIVTTTENLSHDIVSELPVSFVSGEFGKLQQVYSIEIKQYGLSKDAYEFWSELQKINQNLGSLFDPMPTTTTGNIINVNHEDKPVLGYFQVSPVTTKRIYIKRTDLPAKIPIKTGLEYCESITLQGFEDIQYYLTRNWVTIYQWMTNGVFYTHMVNHPVCADCRYGGTSDKPSFWIDP